MAVLADGLVTRGRLMAGVVQHTEEWALLDRLQATTSLRMLIEQYCPCGMYGSKGICMLGTLDVTADSRFALRFERRFAHPQAKVWRAITETDQLRAWFVEILDYDRSRLDFTEAAKLTFVPKGDQQIATGHGE